MNGGWTKKALLHAADGSPLSAENGSLKVENAAAMSGGNTTTAPLGSGETFTGAFEQNGSPDVMVSCQTDNGGTLYFDFSVDGTNFSTFPVAGFVVTSGIHEFHTAVKGPRYFRVRLVNDAGAQSYLRLYCYFGQFRQGNLPINQSVGADADAIVIRSVDTNIDLALGRFGGMTVDTKFGRVKGIDALDDAVDVWAFADDSLSTRADTKTFPTTGAQLYVMSSSAADSTVTVTVDYIDGTGAAATAENVALTGQTPAAIGASGIDINRMYVSNDIEPIGFIYGLRESAATGGAPDSVTDVLAFFQPGLNQTQLSQFTVPTGKKVIIKHIFVTVSRASGAAGSADLNLLVKDSGGVPRVLRQFFPTTSVPVNTPTVIVVNAGSQIVWRVDDVSDTDTNVSCAWEYNLVDV